MLTIENEWWRADGLISVIENSKGKIQSRALHNLLSIEAGEPYSKMFSWLQDFVSTPTNLEIAVQAANEIINEEHRLRILRGIVPPADENQPLSFPTLIEQSNQLITVKNTIYDKVESIFQIEWEEDRANELSYLTSLIPDDLIAIVVDRSKRFISWLHRDTVLNRLAPRLVGEYLTSATQDVADFDDTTSLAHALKHLAKFLVQPQKNEVYSYALEQLLTEGNPKWVSDEILKLRADLDGELREKATAHLPEELQNLTYEELVAQRHAATLKHFNENPDFKKRFDEMMEAARKQYAPEQVTLPQIVQPIEAMKPVDTNQKLHDERIEYLTFLDEARFKKRESVFWLFGNFSALFEENTPDVHIISAIANDIIDIHQNWRWPQ